MKISTIFASAAIALTAMAVNAAELPEISNLYLIGAATPAGWNIGSAIELEEESTGVYTVTTNLIEGQFKFLVSRDNWNSLVSSEYDNYPMALDTTMGLMYVQQGDDSHDYKWFNSNPGTYTLTVDVNNATLTVTKSNEVVITNLYLIGNASPAGWNLGDAPEFNPVDGKLEWIGRLGVGDFKLATTRGNFNAMVSADGNNTGVVLDEPMGMQYNAEGGDKDWKWHNEEAGIYTMVADLENNTLTISKFNISTINELIVVGDALETGWDRGDAPAMNDKGEGIFVWTGLLTTNKGANLKFILGRETWNSICAVKPNNNLINGDWMPLQINYDGWLNDVQWVIGAQDTYQVTVDLNLGSIKIVPGFSAVEEIESVEEAEAVYYNLNGVRVDNVTKGVFVKVANGKAVKIVK